MPKGKTITQEDIDRFVGFCALGLKTDEAARAAKIGESTGFRLATQEKVQNAIAEAQKQSTGFAVDFASVIGDLQNAEHANGDPDMAARAKGADLAGKYFDRLAELGEANITAELPADVYRVYPLPPFAE